MTILRLLLVSYELKRLSLTSLFVARWRVVLRAGAEALCGKGAGAP